MLRHNAAAKTSDYDFSGHTVLLTEDIDINREIVQALLEGTGIAIDNAENGKIALELFAADPARYDLIYMDVQMPVMGGYEATRALRALEAPEARTVPVIAMTANAFSADVEKCRTAGMDDHIAKPIDLDDLLGKTAKHLKQEK